MFVCWLPVNSDGCQDGPERKDDAEEGSDAEDTVDVAPHHDSAKIFKMEEENLLDRHFNEYWSFSSHTWNKKIFAEWKNTIKCEN